MQHDVQTLSSSVWLWNFLGGTHISWQFTDLCCENFFKAASLRNWWNVAEQWGACRGVTGAKQLWRISCRSTV